MKKMLKHDVQLLKLTLSPETFPTSDTSIYDTEGIHAQKEELFNTFNIQAEIQPITMEDEIQAVPGLLHAGDAWGFFLAYYDLEGDQITVDPEDQIICESILYEVVRIEDHYQGNNIVWRRAYLRRVSGES